MKLKRLVITGIWSAIFLASLFSVTPIFEILSKVNSYLAVSSVVSFSISILVSFVKIISGEE